MTPNKPVIAEEARKLLTDANSKLDNDMLAMVSRLADVITYNAETMNKLVNRVDELEKLVTNNKPSINPVIGHKLQVILKQKHVQVIKCVKSNSNLWVEGQAYVILVSTSEPDNRKVRAETGQLLNTSASLFVEVEVKVPTDADKACEALRSQNEEKEYAEHFFAVTRMFMGLPTVQLIHPRSL